MSFLRRTWAEIDLNALVHNFKILKEKSGNAKIMPVVKANAYGHSACAVAPILQQHGADYFAVSNIEEAIELRNLEIIKPILILGYTPVNMVNDLCDHNLTQCVYSKEYAQELSKKAVENEVAVNVHIKLDTGMSRLGFDCRSDALSGIDDAIECAKLQGFNFGGVFTHFANADCDLDKRDGFTEEQYSRFSKAVNQFKKANLPPSIIHCCNSAALLLDDDKHSDLTRAGIALYGLSPSSDMDLKEDLIPVMTVKSVVSMVKEINAGDTVNYGRTFKADKKMKIATVTAGYADGYPRLLSNKGYVLINGKKANIIGRICMDQMSVDVSDIPDVKMGDEVILFGKELKVDVLADICGTINYEIICGISPRVPRIIKED